MHVSAPVDARPVSCKRACLHTGTFTDPAKLLQNVKGEMSKFGLKGPLEVESNHLVQGGSTLNSEEVAQGFVRSGV